MDHLKNFTDDELIYELVARFKKRNDFVKNIDALQDCTPNDWNYQLDDAAKHFLKTLENARLSIDNDLHNGKFLKRESSSGYCPSIETKKVET